MDKIKLLVLCAVSMALFGVVSAQNLDASGSAGSSSFDQPGKPTRGMTQDNVRANYGSPRATTDAIGEPPISRWEYPGFVVFFENDRVIHSVSKR